MHHQAGRLDDAVAGYCDVLKSDPDNADAVHLIGVVAFQRGNLEEARTEVQRAIALNTDVALYHANLGRIEKASGQPGAAVLAYRQSISINPNAPDVLSDLAGALVEAGAFDEALEAGGLALDLQPDFEQAKINQGLAYFHLAREHHDAGHLSAAEKRYREAIRFNPGLSEAHCNLGNILRAGGRLEGAFKCYERALTLSPDQSDIHSNKGVTLQELGRREEAVVCYREAIRLDPDNAEAHRNLAMALLQGGVFDEGWAEFEWRWKTVHFEAIRRDWQKPQWSGERLDGEMVLVHAEQGFGDCFQFARYLPLIAEKGGRVIVEAPEAVIDTLQSVEGVEKIITPGKDLPEFDFHIPVMSLPGAFQTTLENIPAPDGYLAPPRTARNKWQEKFINNDKTKIGLVWKGNPTHPRDVTRSPGLELFRPLIDHSEARFYALQKGNAGDDIRSAGLIGHIVDLENDLTTFADTAAVIEHLDLVITPDTALAHLAGAMGKPVWVLLEHIAEWRWLEAREDSSWYTSARLFRQTKPGDWEGVISRVSGALESDFG